MRRLALLWQQYSQAPEGSPFVLDGEQAAREAGYKDLYKDAYYYVLQLDVNRLRYRDGAVREATHHRSDGLSGITPYWLTIEGQKLLFKVGYPIDPPKEP
jgi:hypothetical protein